MEGMRLGIDLGGTKIEAAAMDERGEIHARRRVATPRFYDELLGTLVQLVRDIEREVGPVRAVGAGTPGHTVGAEHRMRNAENTPLEGQRFQGDLPKVLGKPVRLANDAACFALSEAVDGAGRGARVVFGAIVGTGVGGGLVVDGRLVGRCEWGHNPMPPAEAGDPDGIGEDDVPCSCGRRGCIEALVSGPGLSRDFERATGMVLSAQNIAGRAREGDLGAFMTIARHARRLARALATIINVCEPDVIVLGGGLSAMPELYTDVEIGWRRHVAIQSSLVRLVPNQHGDASGVRGAAWLWPAAH